ncbi:uncharacterized protein [Typha angustifolia]|uniref:uncharacterized protein n=1 Tax=Typha angustifolia TaxID=59011 RepID=UPI003C2EC266
MDDYSSRRAAGGLGFSRRGSGISFRNQNHEDGSNQYCSRLGCSSRLNSMKGSQIDNQEKPRYARPSLRGSTTVSSSRTIFRKSLKEKQKQTFLGETDITESSGRQAELEYSESSNGVILSGELNSDVRQGETEDSLSISTREVTQTVMPDSDDFDSVSFEGSSTHQRIESLAKSTASSSKPHKQRNKQLSIGDPDTCSTSFVRRSSASRNTSLAAKPSQGLGAPRCSLKNLSCTSISDVLPTGCSSADFSRSGRFNTVRRRTDGEIFPARGKGIIGSSSGGYSGSSHTNLDSGLPVAEKSIVQQAGRRSRNLTNNRDGAISVRARRPSNRGSSVRVSDQRDDSSFPLHEIHETVTTGPELQQTQFSLQEALPESISRSYSIELPQAFRSSRRAGSSSTARSRAISRLDESSTQMFHGTLGDRDGYRRLNMEDIAEVLLALDRIEQDEELTYEQLLVLETNLLLGGLTFHDQHRDMRMDIDNMSYEELLALEEKMGTVSTALSDEELAKCITRSIHMSASFSPEITSYILDDTKCSICQEEYDEGDEVGKLGCEHQYHLSCIYQWLKQKNWCPICKASVASSSK